MNDLNVLFVGGNWDDKEGRSSRYMNRLINTIQNKLGHSIVSYNGGNINDLEKILSDNCSKSDLVFWFANIPTEFNKKLNPKDYNHKCILVVYKRNNNKYTFDQLMSYSLTMRADLTCEIFKDDNGKYNMRIFDILGTMWSDFTTNTSKSVAELLSRASSLKSLKYLRLIESNEPIKSQNVNLNDILSTYKDFGTKLLELRGDNSYNIKRHLGQMSFRGYIDPTNRSNDIVYSSARNVLLSECDKESNIVATKLLFNKINYYGTTKPHLDTAIFDKLLVQLPDVSYIFSSDCYINEAPFTERCLPVGCIQEVNEINKVIGSYQYTKDFSINLLGHGSVIFGSTLDYIRSKFDDLVLREKPEPIGTNFEIIEMDDGVVSFISTLNGRPIENGELLEVRFDDDSIGTYNVIIKYYKDDNNIVHKDAYIPLVIKGVETEFPIVGNYARRI